MAEELAFILRSVRYQDAAKVVTFLSREGGLRTGFARGATARDNRFGASLEPLTLCRITGRRSGVLALYRIHHADIVEPYRTIHADFNLLSWAGLVSRFLLGCLPPEHPEPLLFSLTRETLSALETRKESASRLWIRFAREGLAILGYRPPPPACTLCHRKVGEEKVLIRPSEGTVLCRLCRREEGKRGVEVPGQILDWLSGAGDISSLPGHWHEETLNFLDHMIGEHDPKWIPASSVTFLPEARD
ncbi:MAG: DNA repair protein RecO [Nitrospirae bacterium]|nr:DNA repair protein RecO [Nitrospirota bacterium]